MEQQRVVAKEALVAAEINLGDHIESLISAVAAEAATAASSDANNFAQLTTDLQTAKSAFEAFKAASSAKSSAETALENFIANGPIYGDGSPSLTAEQTFVGQKVVLETALKQADDSLHDTVTQGIDSVIQTFDTYLGNNPYLTPSLSHELGSLSETLRYADDANNAVESLSVAIEALAAKGGAQQVYTDSPNATSYNAWVEANSALDAAMNNVKTYSDMPTSAPKIGVTSVVSEIAGSSDFKVTFNLSEAAYLALSDVTADGSGSLTNLKPVFPGDLANEGAMGAMSDQYEATYAPTNGETFEATYSSNFIATVDLAPTIDSITTSVSNTPSGGFGPTSTISVNVQFSESVMITGSPTIDLSVTNVMYSDSPHTVTATYVGDGYLAGTPDPDSNSGATPSYMSNATFSYEVSIASGIYGELTSDRINIVDDSLANSDGGSIVDISTKAADLDHDDTVYAATAHDGSGGEAAITRSPGTSDASMTNLTSISVLDMDGRDLYSGDVVKVRVDYDEVVFVGTMMPPRVDFSLESSSENNNGGSTGATNPEITFADYVSGSGTSTLTFEYTASYGQVARLSGDPSISSDWAQLSVYGASNYASFNELATSLEGSTNFTDYVFEQNLSDVLDFPTNGTIIVEGDASGGGYINLQPFSHYDFESGPGQLTFESQGAGVVHIIENNSLKFVATSNSDGTILLDGTVSATGGTTGLGKLLLKDVSLLNDAYGNEYYTALEDSLDTQADTSHLVNGSIFGGDSLVVDELAGADLSAGWVEDTSDAITKFTLNDANGNLRAELVEPDSSSEYPNTYNLTTYAADGANVLETYAITNTESVSLTGSQGSVMAQLGLVEHVQPIIDTIEVTTDSGSSSDAQIEGDVIITTVNFSEAVFVSGTPTIKLTFGDQTVTATYAGHANHIFAVDAAGTSVEIEAPYSGNISASQAQAFTYTIKQGDQTADATFVSVDATTLDLNGGSILDAAGNIHQPSTITETTTIWVDAVAPEVTSIVMQTDGESDAALTKGDTVTVAVEFTKAVTITGSASIKLAIGPDDSSNPNVVEAYGGNSTEPSTIQYFTYNIGDDQEDADGISVVDGSLTGQSILDTSGNLAIMDHDSTLVGSGQPIKVDSLAPTILSVANPVAAQFAVIGDGIAVTMNFSEPVTLKMGETATLSLLIDKADGTQATVLVSAGSSESTESISGSQLEFTSNALLPTGLFDTDGIQIQTNSLTFTNHGLVDQAGNTVVNTFEEMPVVNQQVDTEAPTVTITSNKSALNSSETAIVTFDLSENSTDFTLENIEVTGGHLSNFAGSDSAYTATFTPTQGISENATFKVLSGSFTDIAGNDNTPRELQITVDTIAPTVSIAMADSVLAIGESTEVTFTFSEKVFGVDDSSISDHITAENGTLSNFGLLKAYATQDSDSFSQPEASDYDYVDASDASNPIDINFANTQVYTNVISKVQRQDQYEFVHQGGAISFDIASNDLDVNGDDELSEIDFHLELTNQDGTRIEKNDDGSTNHTNDDGTHRFKSDGSKSGLDSLLEISSLPAGTYTLNVEDLAHFNLNNGGHPLYNDYNSTTDAPYQLTILTEAGKNVTDVMVIDLGNNVFTATYTPNANVTNMENVISIDMTSIIDSAGNSGVDDRVSSDTFIVDTLAPNLSNAPSVAASGAQNNTLNIGDEVTVTVNFDEPVVVNGEPKIDLMVGTQIVEATYSGEGGLSSEHKFTYTILEGQTDADGISVVENSLSLTSTALSLATEDSDSFSQPEASDYDYVDASDASNPIDINFANTQVYTNVISKVQRQDQYEFVHQGGAISFDIASNDLDVNGDDELSEIDFHLELTNQDGTRIEKNDDGSTNHTNDDGTHRFKSDGSKSGLDSLLEISSLPAGTYTLNVEDLAHFNLNNGGHPLYNDYNSTTDAPYQLTILTEAGKNVTDVMLAKLSNGSIKDAYGNDANLSNLSVIDNDEMKVDAVASKVTGVEITSNEIEFNVLSEGDIINTIVSFDEGVLVTGTPTIKLALNNGTESPSIVEATYSGNGGLSIVPDNVLTFSYVVAAGDIDTSGISVVENSLANSFALGDTEASTILDAAGNAALLDNPEVDSHPSMLVDTIAPQLNVSDSKPTVSFDSETNTIEVTVTFSEKVTLKDGATATLTVLVNNDTNDVPTSVVVTATGTGTNSQSLVFKSTVLTDGLFDTNTVQVQTNSLNYAPDSLFDQAGNLVPNDFDDIDVALDVPIDTRANREIKQEEAYTRFSELLAKNVGDVDAPNLILDVSNTETIAGVETIIGGQGLDQIFGGDTDEHLIGGEGSDFLKGGGGNDLLDGGTGDDYVYADAGDDTVKGGEGNDTILFNKLTVDGNQLVLDLFKDVTAQAANIELGTNTISGIENAVGTNKGDVIDGNGYDNIINGADGDDIINGGRGNDQLFGAADDDVLKGGRGNDTLEGGKGADQLYGGSGKDTFVFDLNDDLLNGDADIVFDFNHYADKIEILGMAENQSVEMIDGTLSIKTEITDGETQNPLPTQLELATGFDTRLDNSHLELFVTIPDIA
ncbi:Ig-like domain-containing protein [Oceanospirillaceae bacterium]|nr:Ig-like domain-containing protein [Oceanospirillaceae bacterium]